jgi:hypothetical protein
VGQAVSPANFQATKGKLRNEPKDRIGAPRNYETNPTSRSKRGGAGGSPANFQATNESKASNPEVPEAAK